MKCQLRCCLNVLCYLCEILTSFCLCFWCLTSVLMSVEIVCILFVTYVYSCIYLLFSETALSTKRNSMWMVKIYRLSIAIKKINPFFFYLWLNGKYGIGWDTCFWKQDQVGHFRRWGLYEAVSVHQVSTWSAAQVKGTWCWTQVLFQPNNLTKQHIWLVEIHKKRRKCVFCSLFYWCAQTTYTKMNLVCGYEWAK